VAATSRLERAQVAVERWEPRAFEAGVVDDALPDVAGEDRVPGCVLVIEQRADIATSRVARGLAPRRASTGSDPDSNGGSENSPGARALVRRSTLLSEVASGFMCGHGARSRSSDERYRLTRGGGRSLKHGSPPSDEGAFLRSRVYRRALDRRVKCCRARVTIHRRPRQQLGAPCHGRPALRSQHPTARLRPVGVSWPGRPRGRRYRHWALTR